MLLFVFTNLDAAQGLRIVSDQFRVSIADKINDALLDHLSSTSGKPNLRRRAAVHCT